MHYRRILKEYSNQRSALLPIYDGIAVLIAAWVAHRVYLNSWIPSEEYSLVVGISLLLVALLFPQFHLYKVWRGVSMLNEIRSVTLAWSTVLLFLFAIAFATKMGAAFSRGWVGLWGLIGWSGLAGGRIALRLALKWFHLHGFYQQRIVIVSTSKLGREVAERLLSSPWLSLHIAGFFCEDPKKVDDLLPRLSVVGSLGEAVPFVEREEINQVWVAMALREEDSVKQLMHELRHSTVDICFVPDIYSFRLLNHSISEVAGLPVLNFSITPMMGINRLVKTLEDRILAFLLLLLISPLMFIIAIGVKLSSPGPAIFKQRRHGWDGKPITVYKFRTMKVHREEKGQITQASKNDSRITPFGAFLRRTSLDELPQFINVLQGQMSIVGPRPHAIEHNEQYKRLINDYVRRHKVKPGITGWAQVNGWRGETNILEKMQKRIEYDLWYIENWSLWFDLKIILLTVFKGFVGQNAY
jgi:putative colanic acid biosynthesis UDP-glucose lipid carrier transferase